MAWGKLEDTFHDDPKWDELGAMLSCDPAHAAGCIASLWSWALRHAPDGIIGKLSNISVARAARWRGDADAFVQASIDCRAIDETENGYEIHGFAKRAESNRRAQQKTRERKAQRRAQTVARQSPDNVRNVAEERRGEERRGDLNTPPALRASPTGGTLAPEDLQELKQPGLDTETNARATRTLEPFALALFSELADEHGRVRPSNYDREHHRAIARLVGRFPGQDKWRLILTHYLSDERYAFCAWSITWLAKNLDEVAGRALAEPTKAEDPFAAGMAYALECERKAKGKK